MKLSQNGKWFSFFCPACSRRHHVDDTWDVSGPPESPTITPSVLSTYRHPKGHTSDNPAPLGYDGEYVQDKCHLFIREGRIEYLGDCTHGMANRVVDMLDIET